MNTHIRTSFIFLSIFSLVLGVIFAGSSLFRAHYSQYAVEPHERNWQRHEQEENENDEPNEDEEKNQDEDTKEGEEDVDEEQADDSGAKIWICHATHSTTNPYVQIHVSVNGLSGHGDHEDDLIPMPDEGCPAGSGGGGHGSPGPKDLDNDGIPDTTDNCARVSNPPQTDTDHDGVGDACDICPAIANADQADSDHDTLGDSCDACPLDAQNDADGDSRCADVDNCPTVSNADQADDADHDGIGNACDLCPYDNTTPPLYAVAIEKADNQNDPTTQTTIHYTVVFSTNVSDFTTNRVFVTGTAGATTVVVTEITPFNGTRYDVAISGMAQFGTVITQITDRPVTSTLCNFNTISTSTDNRVDYISTPSPGPTVTIEQAEGQTDPAYSLPVHFTATFSTDVTDFMGNDVVIVGTAGGPRTRTVTGGPRVYDVAVSDITSNGTLIALVNTNGAFDSGGAGNFFSTSTDNTVTFLGSVSWLQSIRASLTGVAEWALSLLATVSAR